MGNLDRTMKQSDSDFVKQNIKIHMLETDLVNSMPFIMSADPNLSHKKVDEEGTIQVESDSLFHSDPYVTTYVCLLAPRFQEHLLTGDLSDQLYTWMKDICIAFGWNLGFIDIKPEYLHWVMSVSINTSQGQFVKKICKESSQKILENFPRIKRKNMSNEFWAPWYFVNVGQAPYSKDAIKSYLDQIRMQQGF